VRLLRNAVLSLGDRSGSDGASPRGFQGRDLSRDNIFRLARFANPSKLEVTPYPKEGSHLAMRRLW